MKPVTLYPPGGGEPVKVQPDYVEQMKQNGWAEETPKQPPKQPEPIEEEQQDG